MTGTGSPDHLNSARAGKNWHTWRTEELTLDLYKRKFLKKKNKTESEFFLEET